MVSWGYSWQSLDQSCTIRFSKTSRLLYKTNCIWLSFSLFFLPSLSIFFLRPLLPPIHLFKRNAASAQFQCRVSFLRSARRPRSGVWPANFEKKYYPGVIAAIEVQKENNHWG